MRTTVTGIHQLVDDCRKGLRKDDARTRRRDASAKMPQTPYSVSWDARDRRADDRFRYPHNTVKQENGMKKAQTVLVAICASLALGAAFAEPEKGAAHDPNKGALLAANGTPSFKIVEEDITRPGGGRFCAIHIVNGEPKRLKCSLDGNTYNVRAGDDMVAITYPGECKGRSRARCAFE